MILNFFKKKIKLKGYMLAMTSVMVSMIVIISGSISFILMREIGRVNIPISSSLAYNYADTTLRCLNSINDLTVNSSSDGFGVFDFRDTTFINNTNFDDASIKCLGEQLFNFSGSVNAPKIEAIKTLTTQGVNSPVSFYGGYKYTKDIVLSSTDKYEGVDRCVHIETYSTTTDSIPKKLFVITGKVPCTGGVEKVLTKSY
jgi:hypothetical protein